MNEFEEFQGKEFLIFSSQLCRMLSLEIVSILPSHRDFFHNLHEDPDFELFTSMLFVSLMSTINFSSLRLDHFIRLLNTSSVIIGLELVFLNLCLTICENLLSLSLGAAGVSHGDPESPNVHFGGNQHFKHHRNSTRRRPERTQRVKFQAGGGKKKREILGSHHSEGHPPFWVPTIWPSTFYWVCPHVVPCFGLPKMFVLSFLLFVLLLLLLWRFTVYGVAFCCCCFLLLLLSLLLLLLLFLLLLLLCCCCCCGCFQVTDRGKTNLCPLLTFQSCFCLCCCRCCFCCCLALAAAAVFMFVLGASFAAFADPFGAFVVCAACIVVSAVLLSVLCAASATALGVAVR